MKIVSMRFEIVRVTPAVADFLVHVELDGPVYGYEVVGRAMGPQCPGISTVEVVYPMTAADTSSHALSLRCVIPEPNLWTLETPFTYAALVEIRRGAEVIAARKGAVKFRSN